jgi:sigma-B regulation protein RsbQ
MELVLLPGLDGTGDLFAPLVEALAPSISCHVVRYPTDIPQTMANLGAWAARTITAHPGAAVLAESFSGPILLHLLANGTVCPRAVIWAGTFAQPPLPWLTSALRWAPWRLLLWRPLLRLALGRYCVRGPYLDTACGIVGAMDPAVLIARITLVARTRAADLTVPMPCLYLTGSADRLVPRTSSNWFRDHCPRLEIAELPAPHFILASAPTAAASAIRPFLERAP